MTRLLSAPVLALAFLGLGIAVLSASPPQSPSPSHPNFSGTWVLLIASERSPAIARELVVTYSAAKNTLTVSRRAGGPAYTDTYTLGSNGGTIVQGQRGPMVKGLRAMAWEGKVLVIDEITSINRDQDSGREERWSFDDKGQLMTVITVWSPGNPENTMTMLYKRKTGGSDRASVSHVLAREHQNGPPLVGRLERVGPDLTAVDFSGHAPSSGQPDSSRSTVDFAPPHAR